MTPTQIVPSGAIKLAVYQWGQPRNRKDKRQTLVCIHGYPDSAEVWTRIAGQLAERFHVVAYDVRGSGQSSAPRGSAAYAFEFLVDDLRAVIDAVSPKRPVHLLAFDWGALQAWEALLGGRLQGRIASCSVAAPSLDHVGNWFQRRLASNKPADWLQALQRGLGSSYMVMLNAPLLPELTWRLGLGRLWPRIVSALEKTPVKASASLLGDATHGLGLYRANLLPALFKPSQRQTDVPVQLLVMSRDPFVPPAMFEGMEEWAPNLQKAEIEGGHWWPLGPLEKVLVPVSRFIEETATASLSPSHS